MPPHTFLQPSNLSACKAQGGQEVYRYPAPFAHVVWGGDILGKPGLLLAYRNDNGGLLLMRRSEKTGAYYMEHLYIDELVSPTNLAVDSRADEVTAPTPPGTGVTAATTGSTAERSASPQKAAPFQFMDTSSTV